MPKLHQILAARPTVMTETTRLLTLATQGLGSTGEQSPLSGLSRTYEPREEHGDELPGVHQRVQIKVESDILPMIAEAVTRLLDVEYTRDFGNTLAKADVKIGSRTVLADVPTTYLLTLENQLGELRKILTALPVLDPSEEWRWDTNRGFYVGEERKKERSVPVPQVQVLYDAKIEGGVGIPAQVRAYETSKPVGDWTHVRFSGCMPAEKKEGILRRLAQLQEAVKMAREEANRIDVQQKHAGKAVFDFLLGAE